jgi:hypothetical protein
MIYYNDSYYDDLEDLVIGEFDPEDINELPENFTIIVDLCEMEPLVTLSPDWILSRIDDDRFSENGVDDEMDKVRKILADNIDYEKINKLMIPMWYPIGKKMVYDLSDIKKTIE